MQAEQTAKATDASGSAEDEVNPGAAPDNCSTEELERFPLAERMIPGDFYDARPALRHIRRAAHSRLRSADAVLLSVFARIASRTPHTIDLPAVTGSGGSLNFFAALIGAPATGKSSSVRLSGELLPALDWMEPDRTLGSGEGIAETFLGPNRTVDRHNVFIYADEGATMTKIAKRTGGMLAESLRSAWTGETLGQNNATPDRRRHVPQGSYRLGFVIGYQPIVAADLLADDASGTPQRFLFASAEDPNVPHVGLVPSWPSPLAVPPLTAELLDNHAAGDGEDIRHVMTIDDPIARQIMTEQRAQITGEYRPNILDAHRHLHLLKIAAVLAVLDGRLHISAEDWALAGIVWQTSCRVRAWLQSEIVRHNARRDAEATRRYVQRQVAAARHQQDSLYYVDTRARRLARYVQDLAHDHPAGFSTGMLRARFKGEERDLSDHYVGYALEKEWIVETEDGRFMSGPVDVPRA